jgi:tRNA(Ile)-lysidine synthase TilS/MesJ
MNQSCIGTIIPFSQKQSSETKRNIITNQPFVSTEEKEIKAFVRKADLPVIKSACPADGNTERALMKQYLGDFDHRHRGLYARIVGALERGEVDGWKETVYK